MILTGKAKEEFEKWYVEHLRKRDDIGERYFDHSLLNFFWNSGETMINAFVIEWLDSVGIYVSIVNEYRTHFRWTISDYYNIIDSSTLYIQTSRSEATEQAIIKANEIYNSKS